MSEVRAFLTAVLIEQLYRARIEREAERFDALAWEALGSAPLAASPERREAEARHDAYKDAGKRLRALLDEQ